MRGPRLLLSLTLTAALAVAAPVGASSVDPAAGAFPSVASTERARMNQRVFDQVWNAVRTQYYDPTLHGVDWAEARRVHRPTALAATDDRALYRVLNLMLDLLDDDHASAQAPAVARRNDALRQRRAVMGLTLRRDDADPNLYAVESVREGSAAEAAGVREGWRLNVAGDGVWFPEMDVEAGRPVNLALVDEAGAPRPLTVVPKIMEPRPAFAAETPRPGVTVLRIDGFEPGLSRWLGDALSRLPVDEDIVLDLRGNSGGRLVEADGVISCFVPRGHLWATRTSRNGRRVPLRATGGCGDLAGPVANDLAILIDDDSRSAAELTPAALQEARRAVVVGQPTVGAVLISQETRLPDGGKLTLSRADFVTAGGVRLEKRGVSPDVMLARRSLEDRRAGRDPVLDAAIVALAEVENARSPTAAD